jgi:hypothetical protein
VAEVAAESNPISLQYRSRVDRWRASLLADLDVHPRVAMQILRHADVDITMEIDTEVSSKKTREALKRLGESLDNS